MADVSTQSELYTQMEPYWQLTSALRGGTAAMRQAGNTYLPQEPGESDKAYDVRLNRSFLFPGYSKSIEGMTGQIFRKPIQVDTLPEGFQSWVDDVDLSGTALTVFARHVFEAALDDGLTHIHIDFPQMTPGITLADERAVGARPYFRHIKASDVIWWWSERVNGKEVLTEVRIKERARLLDAEGTEVWKDRIRVLKIGAWELWQKKKDDSYEMIETGPMNFPLGIPWVTIYTGRDGFMSAKPPLLDLAYVNVAHWQSSSDQRNILRIARVPFLFASGFKDEEGTNAITISVSRAVRASDPQANLRWVEHAGAAIAAGEKDVAVLKEEMATLGLELLVRKPVYTTATSDTIDKAETDSQLAAMALELQDGLINAYVMSGLWVGLQIDMPLTVNTDFGAASANSVALNALLTSRAQGDISRETFWAELKRYGVLSETFDPEIEIELLSNEWAPPQPELPPGGDTTELTPEEQAAQDAEQDAAEEGGD